MNIKPIFYFGYLLILTTLTFKTLADDTEIYTGIAERDAPNVIFIMDTSGSMSWANDGSRNPPAGESRLEQVQRAAVDTIKNTDGINIALMRFNEDFSGYGGYVDLAMTPIADARTTFESQINSYSGRGGTPITEVMDEALRYLRGDSLKYTKATYYDNGSRSYQTRYYGDAAARIGDTFKSPISHQCQKNHIVLFSDGEPSSDTSSNSYIQGLLNSVPSENRVSGLSTSCSSSGGCAEEIAFYGNQEDLNSSLTGIQNVTFHTVGGFVQGAAQTKLENISKFGSWAAPGKPINPENHEGDGLYSNAQNYEDLKIALQDIFDSIAKTSGTFTAPAVSVNAFNNLEHLDQLYYSVFKPTDNVGWSGNLKRYRLTTTGKVVDKFNEEAVDPDTGFFKESAHSFWTLGDEPDGNEVKAGGVASRLSSARNIGTYLGGSKNLLDASNILHESNAALTSTLLGTPSNYDSAKISKMLQWARGIDVNDEDNDAIYTDARIFMEDPLHSQPVVINYGKDTLEQTFDSSIFISTNAGFLHGFSSDEELPSEHFAFIPSELLSNIYPYYSGISSANKVYGLDGPLSYWHKDSNKNGVLLTSTNTIESDEHIYLYSGMRRGGRNYYALDISDRNNPKYLWQIDGGVGDFEKLGQTWSKMVPATVNWKGNKTQVLFFGGGYNPAEDGHITRTNHSIGNAIFMVDAETGSLLWFTSNSGASLNLSAMRSSIVSDIVPIDTNQDGFVNMLYAADTGGRIWRIDIDQSSSSASTFAKGGAIADFNGNSSSTNYRFFNTPDIAYTKFGGHSTQGQFQISIGSGYRAHPLDTRVNDRFYILNDFDVFSVPSTYVTLSTGDIANEASFSSASDEQIKNGVYYTLTGNGEKVLASSITIADNILFTTYRPDDSTSVTNCDADTGSTRLYQVSPLLGGSTSPDSSEREWELTDLAQGGIPPNPVVLFPPSSDGSDEDGDGDGDDGDCQEGEECPPPESDCEQLKAITAIGAETVNNSITRCDQLSRSYWHTN